MLLLACGRRADAERAHAEACAGVPGYGESELGSAAGELLALARNGETEAFAKMQKGARLAYLDAFVVRAMREMPPPGGAEDLEDMT